MNKEGPIIVIEDDEDDRDFIIEAFKDLPFKNSILFFEDGEKALDYLMKDPEEPFIILSDINMPKLSGLELKEKIQNNADLKLKCIPYLFFTTSANYEHVIKAYSHSAQGFFVKPIGINNLTILLKKIVEYWMECESPRMSKGNLNG